jgi:hypothetical protein
MARTRSAIHGQTRNPGPYMRKSTRVKNTFVED